MKNKYDAIIVGAGIGGLVCGNFLAKSGLSVLIVEKNQQPGGYCVSFTRGRFTFDAGPHSLGSCRENGQIGKLFSELDLNNQVKLGRKDPSDIILAPGIEISFFNDTTKTIKQFQDKFPDESKNIEDFFEFLQLPNIGFLYAKLRNLTFKDLVDHYFEDDKLKLILGLILGNLGLAPAAASAFTATILYREYVLDGGYYPRGGMQVFSNALANKFISYGGELKLSTLVDRIIVNSKKVAEGVILSNGDKIYSKYVVANCDANQLYFNLIDEESQSKIFIDNLKKMIPSLSFFTVYLGLKENMRDDMANCSTLWYFPKLNLDEIYKKVSDNSLGVEEKYIVCGFPSLSKTDVDVMHLLVLAPFLDKEYWSKNKTAFANNLIKRAEAIFPDLSSKIERYSIATPYDFYRYTLNTNGAISGWCSTPDQIQANSVSMVSPIGNLILTGHWAISSGGQGGVPMVAYSGKMAAKQILTLEEQFIK